MKAFRAIFFRELRSYFDSPIGYIFLVVFLLVNCGLFMSPFFIDARAEMRTFFGLLPLILVAFIPAITMRLWAEERKLGTIELLMTLPVGTHQVVLAKFAASFVFFLIALLGTWTIPMTLALLGNPDPGPIVGGYVGSALLGAFYLSVGIFASALSRDQIVAFILGLILCYMFYILGADYIASQLDGWTGQMALGTVLQNHISLAQHFEGIERGVIAIKDIVYFISMTALFLFLNIQFLNKSREGRGKARFIAITIIFFLIAAFANLVASGFSAARFDLTEERLFTVSQASKNILAQLKAPVMVKYYVTSKGRIPTSMKNLERDVTDKLEELRIASNNRLIYEVVDPSANPELQKKIRQKGIAPFQVQSFEKDEIAIQLVYSSLSIAYLDRPELVINPIHSQNLSNLEYELISKVYKLSLDRMPTVALYAPGEVTSPQSPGMEKRPPAIIDKYSKLERLLKHEKYDVMRINLDRESPIPEGTDTLVIARPRWLNERQRYEINRFLVNGGNVILAIQNYAAHYLSSGVSGVEVIPVALFPQINRLIEGYGVTVEDAILMDTEQEVLSLPVRPQVRGLSTSPQNMPVKLPIQVRATPEVGEGLAITNKIASLLYLWGSPLVVNSDIIKDVGLKVSRLVSSSAESWSIPYRKGIVLTNATMTPRVDVGGEKKPLAVLIEGVFPDLFEGKYVPLWPDDESYEEVQSSMVKDNQSQGKMIVIGNGEMFNNGFLEALSNGVFILNSVDSLSIGNEIINVRARFQSERRIRKVTPSKKLSYRFFVIFFMPIVVIIAGIIRFLMRRKEKMDYVRMLKN